MISIYTRADSPPIVLVKQCSLVPYHLMNWYMTNLHWESAAAYRETMHASVSWWTNFFTISNFVFIYLTFFCWLNLYVNDLIFLFFFWYSIFWIWYCCLVIGENTILLISFLLSHIDRVKQKIIRFSMKCWFREV